MKGTLQGFGRVTLEGLPFKLSLKGGFKGALKERGLEGVWGEGGVGMMYFLSFLALFGKFKSKNLRLNVFFVHFFSVFCF